MVALNSYFRQAAGSIHFVAAINCMLLVMINRLRREDTWH